MRPGPMVPVKVPPSAGRTSAVRAGPGVPRGDRAAAPVERVEPLSATGSDQLFCNRSS